jgi:hypothetical protein
LLERLSTDQHWPTLIGYLVVITILVVARVDEHRHVVVMLELSLSMRLSAWWPTLIGCCRLDLCWSSRALCLLGLALLHRMAPFCRDR